MPTQRADLDGTAVTVVDDSPTVCRAIESTLSAHGARVTSYSGGLEALHSLPGTRPDLILCDILLPDINGYEICSTVRRTPTLRRTPIVLISGVVDETVGARARGVGAVGLLRKPFTDRQLVQVVQRVMARVRRSPGSGTGDEPASPTPFDHLIRELRRMEGFRHGLVLDGHTVVRHFGDHRVQQAEAVVREVRNLLSAAGDLALRFGGSDDFEVLLTTPSTALLVYPSAQNGILVAAFQAHFFLGQARLALRKFREQADPGRSPSRPPSDPHPR